MHLQSQIRYTDPIIMRVLIIDNHDSFVYNIVGLLENIRRQSDFAGMEWMRVLNDDVSPESALDYDAIILSPGPGLPCEAGYLMPTLAECADRRPIFGICLGFQAIARHFGASLMRLPLPRHGHPGRLVAVDPHDPVIGCLAGEEHIIGRYHSWIVDPQSLPPSLIPSSYDDEGNVMSLRHRELPIFGTQFHPESIITDCGERIMTAFLHLAGNYAADPL